MILLLKESDNIHKNPNQFTQNILKKLTKVISILGVLKMVPVRIVVILSVAFLTMFQTTNIVISNQVRDFQV